MTVRRLVLDASAQIARVSNHRTVAQRVASAIRRELEEEPALVVCTSHVAYREFLRHLVAHFITLRDFLVTHYFVRSRGRFTFDELRDSVETAADPALRSRGVGLVLKSVGERFRSKREIRTREAIRFLDFAARDYKDRRFFQLRLRGRPIELPREGEGFLNGIDCLARSALRSREKKGSRCLCRLANDKTLCPQDGKGACLDGSESPIRCCSRDRNERCRLQAFVDEDRMAGLLARIHEHAEVPGFSATFVARHEEMLKQVAWLRARAPGAKVPFIGAACAEHFTPVLMLLECADEGSRLLSFERTFDELGAAIGQPGLRVDPAANGRSAS